MASIPKVERVFRKRVRLKPSDEDVGYGKPPKANQFKPGKSGNPKGRPKGARSEATMLVELLNRKIEIRQNGKVRKITILEGILHKLAEDSLKGNTKSAAFVLNRLAAIASTASTEPEVNPDDKAVLDAYLRNFQSTLGEKEKTP
ncbi:MAG: hypothetical protein CL533_18310 [Afipia sp.]|jgi:hypothetical protein|uniref:DUF5681 domain-containing protein n=1 Tax=Afipia massiliensis TaxID=211460 RepID=A0A840N4U0_9BRAD|nr:DUF5681 domain-containing protein [Afipia massiliensis]MAH71173.1 hypothetical protein [Afipia sp.]OUX59699.1 MAG: hypothetical protein CBB64_18265 [Afipia sp. TMED4]MBB5053644.1 hypothetical protein [Afipia massiliensis]HAO41389.1 hypothetical protein [Afipia sp.]HAQ94145.1 hypothetical protein [Afipia sp.]